ncbi:HNH endonuclease [Cyclobacterium jeungdonense]|uniref:HNH endonuclease n=1 Tax=Cyclobacterium jeungdonense TaxID=708087 RepID=A0ABT8C6H5_9BACT|nr:hypothetical protein [Cyclobacterium jeungdonense]MDN3687393.1 hypothetical protein [Cyclobacterium jeungdonense]
MFKKSLLGDKVHLFNAALYSYYKKKQSKHDKEINKLKSFYAYKRRCRLKSEWFEEEYNEYLSSEVWHYKRERVLKRDEKICRACGINEATQVHHLSYRFVGNEPLFDLVSICARCHDKITQLDENEVKNNFNIE